MFVFEKNQMNTLDKSLKFKYIPVMWLYILLQLFQGLITVSRQKSSICVQMCDNLADILKKLAAKKPVKSRLLCVVRENPRLKIYAKIWQAAPKITKTRKLQHYFPIIVNTLRIIVIKTGKKTKTVWFSSIYIRDFNLAPIRLIQFVPRFFPRCPLYSFIISML